MFTLFFLIDLIGMACLYGFMVVNADLPKDIKVRKSISFGLFAFAALCFYFNALL